MLERGRGGKEGGDGDGEWDAPCVVDLTGVELDLDDLAALEKGRHVYVSGAYWETEAQERRDLA